MKKQKITLQAIRDKAAAITEAAKVDNSGLNDAYAKLNQAVTAYQVAVHEGELEKAEKLQDEIEKHNKAVKLQKTLKYVAANGGLESALSSSSALVQMARDFEKEQLAEMAAAQADQAKLIEEFKVIRDKFLAVNYALGQTNFRIWTACQELSFAAEYNTDLNPTQRQRYHSENPTLFYASVDASVKQKAAFSAGHHGQDMPTYPEASAAE